MELFLDLVYVALISQLAQGLRSDPSIGELAVFVGLFASVWWVWVNVTFVVNVSTHLTRRQLGALMLFAVAAVSVMAAAAPSALGDRASWFAAGNALLRIVLFVAWAGVSWSNGLFSRRRIFFYNALTALLWGASILLPQPWMFLVWAAVLIIEVTMLVTTNQDTSGTESVFARANISHLSERLGLLVMIVLGESVLVILTGLGANLGPLTVATGVFGLAIVAGLAWVFFIHGIEALERGLNQLASAGRWRALQDTLAFLPFALIIGITVISASIANAIADPEHPLPPVSFALLWGGIVLFYVSNAAIGRRFGKAWNTIVWWAIPAVALPAIFLIFGQQLAGAVALASSAATQAVLVIIIETGERHLSGSKPLPSR